MRLLALTGEPAGALAHYEEYRRLLADELGVTPSAATAALIEQIKTGHFLAQHTNLEDGVATALPSLERDVSLLQAN